MERIKHFFHALLRRDQWHIGVVAMSHARGLLSWRKPDTVAWLPRVRGHYRTRPFITSFDGKTALFYEEYIFAEDIGHLACREIVRDDDGTITFGEPMRIAGPHSHRSYPYTFEDSGTLWMISEEAACGNVMLYRCTTFPHVWEPVQELIADFPGVRPTLAQYDNRYWLFVERSDDATLHLFWADALTGPWQPHAGTPFRNHALSARSAGRALIIDGALLRPVQSRHRDAITLQHISVLTPELIRVHDVTTIVPWNHVMRGMQTLSYDATSQLCAFDIKTHACLNDVLARTWAKITAHLRRRYVPAAFL